MPRRIRQDEAAWGEVCRCRHGAETLAMFRAAYWEEQACSECREQKPRSGHAAGQWKRDAAARVCKECVAMQCLRSVEARSRLCEDVCHAGAQMQFLPRVSDVRSTEAARQVSQSRRWDLELPLGRRDRLCSHCAVKVKDRWLCAVCVERNERKDFSVCTRRRACQRNGKQRRDACVRLAAVLLL